MPDVIDADLREPKSCSRPSKSTNRPTNAVTRKPANLLGAVSLGLLIFVPQISLIHVININERQRLGRRRDIQAS
jgi:hypothetical protein